MKMHSILAFVLSISAAFATSFYIRPFSEFTKTTPNIIRGKMNNIHVDHAVNSDGEKIIYTYANLDVKDVIKGSISGTQIKIRKLGGTKDGVTLEIPSSVEFVDKEEGVYFLSEELEDHSYEVSSLELGKFTVAEKNGEEILKGGIFAYSQPKPGHEHDVMADNISENLKPWSINQLKELVKTQQQLTPVSTAVQKNSVVTAPSGELKKDNESISISPSEQNNSVSEPKENSSLYFGSSLWYSLAIIILTLGVFWFKRRG